MLNGSATSGSPLHSAASRTDAFEDEFWNGADLNALNRAVFGVPPELQLRILGYTWSIDLALSPIGLLAAFGVGAVAAGGFSVATVAPTVGPALGGMVTQALSWRWL